MRSDAPVGPATADRETGANRLDGIRVLNLVTSRRPFFDEQVSVLERRGITQTTLELPGQRSGTDSRSVAEYLRYYPLVLRARPWTYDVVHANFGLTGPFALAQWRRPVVLSLWGSDLLGEFGWLGKACARLADETIVMSDEMFDELGVDDAHVIPHGIDLTQFRPIPTATARRRVGWNETGPHVLFPYDPDRPEKNYPLAEEVVAATADRLGESVALHAVHGVEHEEVPYYMNAADALLLTSDREGSPNAVKEAMACNCPVVARDVGDVRDRLADVRGSAVVADDADLPDRLAEIVTSDTQNDGREHVQHLSLERMGDDLIDVYRRALR
ncbi:glycosyltransferase family 4 protein [Salinirubrum litoreum]|uniref:Glycosyltransferase family 4 protein n=1 Tax=Salinirubrum litoreum TaxID=1126234 RepID=A0ABD5RD48_9EURY|nr:glycosyltransferase family 4 protein [Salinirubrum litoreum]